MFSGVLTLSIVFVIFFVLETRGKTLEDIERHYTGEVKESTVARAPSAYRVSSLANLKPTPSVIL